MRGVGGKRRSEGGDGACCQSSRHLHCGAHPLGLQANNYNLVVILGDALEIYPKLLRGL